MKLLIKITSSNIELEATYTRGKLRQITLKKGKLTAEQWQKIGNILPPTESEIETFKQRLNTVVFSPLLGRGVGGEANKLYQNFTKIWFSFYERYTGFAPRFNAVEGKHLKQIIAYFQQVSHSDTEATELWEVLLNNWHKLDAFHQKNTDLKYINSNLNKILQNAKQQTYGTANRYSEHFKRQIFENLQS